MGSDTRNDARQLLWGASLWEWRPRQIRAGSSLKKMVPFGTEVFLCGRFLIAFVLRSFSNLFSKAEECCLRVGVLFVSWPTERHTCGIGKCCGVLYCENVGLRRHLRVGAGTGFAGAKSRRMLWAAIGMRKFESASIWAPHTRATVRPPHARLCDGTQQCCSSGRSVVKRTTTALPLPAAPVVSPSTRPRPSPPQPLLHPRAGPPSTAGASITKGLRSCPRKDGGFASCISLQRPDSQRVASQHVQHAGSTRSTTPGQSVLA